MIPAAELQRFRSIVDDAVTLAGHGLESEGYDLLDLGLSWAEAPPIHPVFLEVGAPEPWAEDLVDLYRRAIVAYTERYGMPLRGLIVTPTG
jgi:hypothetical protein